MNLLDGLIIFAAVIILVTVLARLNDIRRTPVYKRWWIRRAGLLLVSVCMVITIASYFTISAPHWEQVTKILGLWGTALMLVTTPNAPPWWKWISRHDTKGSGKNDCK